MEKVASIIENIVKEEVLRYQESFREPIIGYAAADDPLYDQLSDIIQNKQLHPKELLPAAKTVVVYFIPHSLAVVKKIQEQNCIVKEWSDNYTLGNQVLSKIGELLQRELQKQEIQVVTEPPTNNYDSIELTAKWAHKASAVIAGIGTFGLNHLVITKSGTAGRLGSVVIDRKLLPTPRPDTEYCLYYKTGKCKVCVEKCPSGALTKDEFDRFRCNAYLDGKNIHELEQGCGMCSSGPCASRGF
jgi:epoxyqueuosine reductase